MILKNFSHWQSCWKKSKRSRVEKRDRIILLKSRIDDLKEADITEEEYIELEK